MQDDHENDYMDDYKKDQIMCETRAIVVEFVRDKLKDNKCILKHDTDLPTAK